MVIGNSKYKSLLVDIFAMLVVSGVVFAIFMIYFMLVGIPSTQARNLYNAASGEQDQQKKIELLEQSLALWPEQYVVDELNLLKATQNSN